MTDAGAGVDFTMREWEQAWAHTRHLESMRGQYLGFFFTAVLGVTAVAGPSLVEDSLRSSGALLTVAALGLALQVLAGFLYLAIVRLNDVLGYYLEIIHAIKAWMAGSGAAVDLRDYAMTPPPARPWAGTSGVSERVFVAGLIAFPIVLAAAVLRAVQFSGFSTTTAACSAALGVALATGVVVRRGGQREKRNPREASARSERS